MRQTNRLYISSVMMLVVMFAAGCARTGAIPFGAQAGGSAVPQILSRIVPPQFPDRDYDVTKFGAVADGRTDARPAFAQAINQCNAEGGGRVVVPAGRYQLNGPIHLKSNVNLHLNEGAYIKFSSNPADYLPLVLTRWEGTELFNYSPLVYAYQAANVAITGGGTLDGSGGAGLVSWYPRQKPDVDLLRKQGETGVPVSQRIYGEGHYLRPGLVQLFGCNNILIEDVTLLDSPFWVTHLVGCKNVTVRRIRVDSHNPNSDGIDPESCVDVLIEDCDFDTMDDCVAIKSGRDQDGWRLGQPSENVIVRRCKMNSERSALCVGSEMSGGARRIYWEDCAIEKVAGNALNFKTSGDRGGHIQDVSARNITVGQAGLHAIWIDCDYRYGYRGGKHWPRIERLDITNITVGQTGKGAFRLVARPELPARDIRLKNISVKSAGKPSQFSNVEALKLKNVRVGDQIISAGIQ